mmetsp:Transcript_25367/g.56115  ORF Transcript_25367/g.56115 Transcript_25367/m.56115 type:complete len:346 (+) Transcript_25367:77-1114(+)|eukprot:CAMPEP_0170622674 /NCGR_PEP_ID=MMETSP0224-20130122/29263_1 /TAXON_ID=285029 /ORGANISM="Togula jolla, Strain CCCM 725" /LENGTH=345 /DNA_ID=CAMNT_0010949021 /DNA_START=77 /DNA_END=1114 /DNA_ORIENTATION=-
MAGDQALGRNITVSCALFAAYIGISASVINFNKFLLLRFPYPWEMTALHMFFCSLMSLLLYGIAPGLFPAMERMKGHRMEMFKFALPLGGFFAISLYASNKAYLYCSIAFLQFMKESNLVMVFLMCCAVGLQQVDRVKGVVVIWILGGSWMCIHGELNFTMIGFVIQAVSQLAECSKNVMGEYLMSQKEFKLDPMTYTMLMAPFSLLFLSMGVASTWDSSLSEAAHANWHYLLASAFLAYALNLVIAMVIKNSSAMGFTLAGMVKDILIVIVASHLFGDIVTGWQYLGFTVTLAGCCCWSLLKLMPHAGVARFLKTITGMPESREEHLPLMPDSKMIKSKSTESA